MKKNGGMNALLIELVIVLFFFILSFSVLAQVYTHAYLTENQAALESRALFEGKNVAALLAVGKNPETQLKEQGFEQTDKGWEKAFDGYALLVHAQKTEKETGVWWEMDVSALQEENVLFTLPAPCYIGEVGL